MGKDSILITGINGFIGSNIGKELSRRGFEIVGIDIHPSPLEELLVKETRYFNLNLPNAELGETLSNVKPNYIIHCAGASSVNDSFIYPEDDFKKGPDLTFFILNAVRINSPETKFIFLSSAAVYGNPPTLPIIEDFTPAPISPYGFHKLQSEMIVREFFQIYSLRSAVLRIFSAYGQGLKRQVIWDICQKAKNNRLLLKGNGSETRDFIHIKDIAVAIECIIRESSFNAVVYNLGSETQTTIEKLAGLITKFMNTGFEAEFDGAIPEGNPAHWKSDISRLRALGFSPEISLEDGLSEYVKWFMNLN